MEASRRITGAAPAAPDREGRTWLGCSQLLTGILFWLSPLLLVGGLLALAGWRDRRALAATARQVRLSDALADEVGPIVAPVVERRRGTWRVSVAVPLGRPALVARILSVLDRTLGRLGPERYEIVLSPQAAGAIRDGMPAAGRATRAGRVTPGVDGTGVPRHRDKGETSHGHPGPRRSQAEMGREISTSSWAAGPSVIGG